LRVNQQYTIGGNQLIIIRLNLRRAGRSSGSLAGGFKDVGEQEALAETDIRAILAVLAVLVALSCTIRIIGDRIAKKGFRVG